MASDVGEVMEQQLEVDLEVDDDRTAQLLAELLIAVCHPILVKLRSVVTEVPSQMYDFGKGKLKTLRIIWENLKAACGGGENADADLINFLTNRYLTDFFSLEKSRKVLCIVGPSRRATDVANKIATRLFEDTRKDFKHHLQVKLPEGPADPAKILAHIHANIVQCSDSGQDLIQKIKKLLRPVKYLILIPDLRDAKTWDEIESAFPDNRRSSRVIITTCRLDVAEQCFSCVSDLIYKVRPRPADGEGSAEDGCLDREGSEKYDSADEEGPAEDDTVGTLLSECTDDLRDCSLYLSTVRDVFERASMVRKWVAEGLVQDEKVGHEHFVELFSRDVILAEQTPSKFRAEPAYVVNHKMLSDLRKKSEEDKFAAHVDAASAEKASSDPMVATNKITRLSLSCGPSTTSSTSQASADDGAKPETFLKRFNRRKKTAATRAEEQRRDNLLGHARSMTIRGHGKGLLMELDGGQLLLLDLQGCEDLNNRDMVYICGHLTRLKYLSINTTPISEIPPDIKNLQDLQTLDLRETKVAVLPPEIYELPRLAHLFVSDWLKMTKEYQTMHFRSSNGNHLLFGIAVLDIRVSHLDKSDLDKLGSMINLRSLAVTLTGLPTEELVITKELLFGKLLVFALNCHVPWITFSEGAMPELSRLYLWLYAGPRGKTPSGTNHLKKLHEVTLRYSKHYEGSVCVEETTRAMLEEGSMRARPTTFVINETVTVPKIQVPSYSRQTFGWLVRKFMRAFYDYVVTLLLPFASKLLRPRLARMTERELLLVFPLFALLFYCQITILIMVTPMLIKVAIWLARRALHWAALHFLYSWSGKSEWTYIVIAPIAAYHIFSISILAYCFLSPAVQLVCTALFWFPSLLMRLVPVYILSPLRHTLFFLTTGFLYTLAAVFSLLATLVIPVAFDNRQPPFPNFLPHLLTNNLLTFLSVLAVWIYSFPKLPYYAVTAIPPLVRSFAEWLVCGP